VANSLPILRIPSPGGTMIALIISCLPIISSMGASAATST
jgi:hypothetical protein